MSFTKVRALVIVGALVTCAVTVVVVALLKDHQSDGPTVQGCSKDAIIANLDVPEPKDVKIKVFDGSGGSTSITGISRELTDRGFQVTQADPATEPQEPIAGTAVIRYGPKSVGAAWMVQAHFLLTDSESRDFRLNRTDPVVDIVVGSGFRKLATTSEVKQAIWQNGRPTEPPGTCAQS